MKKKKTYVFSKEIIENLKDIQEITKQSETQIISDALNFYLRYVKNENELVSKLDFILEKIEKLSLELGACKERVRYLEEKLSKCKENNS